MMSWLEYLRSEYSDYYTCYPPEWAKLVKERDNNTCQVCGNTQDLRAHHILYRKFYPQLKRSINNGITLCIPCEREVHLLDDVNGS